jgi:hypothetical protein
MVAPARSMKDTLPDGLFSHNSPQTSREAAKIVVPYINEIQATVLAEVRKAGEHGITDYELENGLGNHSATLRSRRAELVAKGLVQNSGQRRKQNGSNRTVWVAVEKA